VTPQGRAAKDESQASELKVLEQEEKQEAKDAKEAILMVNIC